MAVLSAPELAATKALMLSLLTRRATVYAEGATPGVFDAVQRTDLACEITRPAGGHDTEGVVDVLGYRLAYDPAYDLSERSQVEIDGIRWNVGAGSIYAERAAGGDGAVMLMRCDLVRAR